MTRTEKSPSRAYFGFGTGNRTFNYYVGKVVVLNINKLYSGYMIINKCYKNKGDILGIIC